MRAYLSLGKIRFLHGLQYRTAALFGIITQFLWGLMEILMFQAFYQADPQAFPMEFSTLVSYIWLQQAFLALYAPWIWDQELFACIANGDIAYSLCRPMNLYGNWFVSGMAQRLSKAVLRCVPVLLIAYLLPEPYRMTLPCDLPHFLLFLFSFCLAFLVLMGVQMLVYIAAFYLINVQGLTMFYTSTSEFLSGSILPLPFLPQGFQQVIGILPFASMQNIPFRIYGGDLTMAAIPRSLFLQGLWVILLFAIGLFLMKKVMHKICIQGG